MKKMKNLNLMVLAIIMSLLYTAVSVFAAEDVTSAIPNIFDMFGLSFLFTKETFLILAASISISAFLVTFLEWLGVVKSKHYIRNLLSFSFIGLFIMISVGNSMIGYMASLGILTFVLFGGLFFAGVVGQFLVKHYQNKKMWQTDKISTNIQEDQYKANQNQMSGLSQGLKDIRAKIQAKEDHINTHNTNSIKTLKDAAEKGYDISGLQNKIATDAEKLKGELNALKTAEETILAMEVAQKEKTNKEQVERFKNPMA